jgi:hypothetical protein
MESPVSYFSFLTDPLIEKTRPVADLCENEVIAIDGKSMRGSRRSGWAARKI